MLLAVGMMAVSCKSVEPNWIELPAFESVEISMYHYTYYSDYEKRKIVGGENLVDRKGAGTMFIERDNYLVSFDRLTTIFHDTDTLSYAIHTYTESGIPETLVLFDEHYVLLRSGLIPDRYSFLTYIGSNKDNDVKLQITFYNEED